MSGTTLYSSLPARGKQNRPTSSRSRIHINAAPSTVEAHASVDERKNRVIPAESDVFPRQEFCPALAYNDIAGDNHFTAEFFHTQPFADAVAAILNAALSFFMSHRKIKS